MRHSQRIDYFIVKKCVNSCIFCSEKNKLDDSEIPFIEVQKVLLEEKKKGAQLVHFVGGEPTLHTNFYEILKYGKSLGYSIFIITNGIKFSEEAFAKKILPFLDEIMVSIHGHNEKIHTLCTNNPASFQCLVKGLENIKKYFKGRLEATTCVNKYNYCYLKEIAKLIHKFGIQEYQIMSIVPTGAGGENYYEINPRFEQIKPFIFKTIQFCEKEKIKIRFSGFPMCVLGPKYYIYSYDLWENFTIPKTTLKSEPIELWKEPGKNLKFKIKLGRIKTSKCKKCKLNDVCGGIYEKYFIKYGDKELTPFL